MPRRFAAARKIVQDLGARSFAIKKPNSGFYHAFGSFASPLVIALMAAMERVGIAAGIRPKDIKSIMQPLLQQTLRNYLDKTAAAAFSGPLVPRRRGDGAAPSRRVEKVTRSTRTLHRAGEGRATEELAGQRTSVCWSGSYFKTSVADEALRRTDAQTPKLGKVSVHAALTISGSEALSLASPGIHVHGDKRSGQGESCTYPHDQPKAGDKRCLDRRFDRLGCAGVQLWLRLQGS